ncbi:MAG: GIY-YIG nuclease family protein [Planctomycetota bacterium]|jgi:putative endonuclease
MFVYILECKDGSFYTGIAKDLEKRMTDHGKGSRYTRAKKPKTLVYVEEPENAYTREPEIKNLSRKQKENLLKSNKNIVAQFSHIKVT